MALFSAADSSVSNRAHRQPRGGELHSLVLSDPTLGVLDEDFPCIPERPWSSP